MLLEIIRSLPAYQDILKELSSQLINSSKSLVWD